MDSLDLIDKIGRGVFAVIAFAALGSTRLVAMMMVMPAFSWTGLTGLRKMCVALALSLPAVAHVPVEFSAVAGTGIAWLAILAVKEVLIGLLLGLGYGIPFFAVAAAGDVFDTQRGSSMAYMVDPTMAQESSISGTLLELVMLALFYAGGGPRLLLGGLYDSFSLWPVLAPLPGLSAVNAVQILSLLDQTMHLTLLVGAPVFIVLFMVDLTMGLLARIAPQLHVFDISLPIKGIAVFAILPVYTIFYVQHAAEDLGAMRDVVSTVAQFLK